MSPKVLQQEMQLLRFGWILLLANSIAILAFGILVAAYPQIVGPDDEGLLRSVGVATTGMGIFGVMITLGAYRKGEKWAWFTLWYYPVFWVLHLVAGLPPGEDHIHQVVFIAVSVTGLLLPVKHFFPRSIQR